MEENIKKLFNDEIQNMQNYIMFEIKARQIELTPELKAKNRTPIPLSMGAPVDPVPDFVINKAIEYMHINSLHTYTTPKGEVKFLEAAAKRMKERFKVELNPKNEIFSLIGSKEGLANLIRALVNAKQKDEEKDVILIPSPGYASYTQMIKVAGAKAYGIELNKENNYTPNMEDVLERYIKEGNDPKKIKALLINYPNNPLGCTCDLDYLQHCVDFCKKHGIILISDNAYCEMYYDENYKPHSALECKGAMDCCVEFYSFSKSYAMTGWRLGWACGNKDIITMLSRAKSSVDTGVFKVISNNRTQDFYLVGTCPTAGGTTKCLYGADGDCKNLKMVFTKIDVPPAATAVTNITGGSPTTGENPDAIAFPLTITPNREDGPDESLSATWDTDKIKYTMNNGIETFTCTVSGSNEAQTFSTHDTDGQYQATLTMTETAL